MGRRADTPTKLQATAPQLSDVGLVRAARWFLADGNTIEAALDAVMVAAKKEWPDARIVFLRPAQFLINGGAAFIWPENGNGK